MSPAAWVGLLLTTEVGSFLVGRIVNGQFGGQLIYDWKPEGLVVRLSVPLERLTK